MNKPEELELQRLQELMKRANVPQIQRDALLPVIENVSWMRTKLDTTRAELQDAAVAIPYDHGGGQSGLRESPAFKGYLSLWRGYLAGLEKLTAVLPKDLREEAAGGSITPLETVRKMRVTK